MFNLIVYICISVFLHVLLIPTEAWRGHQIPWNQSSRQLLSVIWVPRTKLRSSGRTASGCWAISPCRNSDSFTHKRTAIHLALYLIFYKADPYSMTGSHFCQLSRDFQCKATVKHMFINYIETFFWWFLFSWLFHLFVFTFCVLLFIFSHPSFCFVFVLLSYI